MQSLKTTSLSEYGCNTNTREFNEVKALYSEKMTGVYSGGLVYEYTEEGSKYGIVKVADGDVEEKDDFDVLKEALAKTQSPKGDGGYKKDGKASQCPKKSKTWNVDMKDDELPTLPKGADEYFKNGAGKGPGLKGSGSQQAGTKETDLSPAASGAVTSGAGEKAVPTESKGAAPGAVPDLSMAPFVCGLVVVVSTLLGASLI